jgi:hypothetical protein
MENFENTEHANNLLVTDEMKIYLNETSKWGKFLAIMGFIGMGLMVLLAFFMMLGFSTLGDIPQTEFPLSFMGFFYFLFALIYFFPVNYLYKFSIQVKKGITTDDQSSLTSGFQNIKSLFKFLGIFTIVILSLYALILVIAVPTLLLFN